MFGVVMLVGLVEFSWKFLIPGPDCSVADCPGTPDCSSHGNCNSQTAQCDCDLGWTGNSCSIRNLNFLRNF